MYPINRKILDHHLMHLNKLSKQYPDIETLIDIKSDDKNGFVVMNFSSSAINNIADKMFIFDDNIPILKYHLGIQLCASLFIEINFDDCDKCKEYEIKNLYRIYAQPSTIYLCCYTRPFADQILINIKDYSEEVISFTAPVVREIDVELINRIKSFYDQGFKVQVAGNKKIKKLLTFL